jgi:gas vesicle protein
MIAKLARVLSGAAIGYVAYRRYRDGDFSAVNMSRCKSSLADAAECAKEKGAELKSSAKRASAKVASEVKGVSKEV